uniref:Uncharacterized protein n=1 Tax=Romanomermis culicivorax TaxID=13658 RepID=A0A915I9W3_ROMCU
MTSTIDRRKMGVPFVVLMLFLSLLQLQCDGQPCTAQDASMLKATKVLLGDGSTEVLQNTTHFNFNDTYNTNHDHKSYNT